MHNPFSCNRAALQLTRGIEKTVAQLVEKLAETSTEVTDDGLADVAAVSAGNNRVVRPRPCTGIVPPPAPSCGMGVSEAQAVEESGSPNSGCCQSSQGAAARKQFGTAAQPTAGVSWQSVRGQCPPLLLRPLGTMSLTMCLMHPERQPLLSCGCSLLADDCQQQQQQQLQPVSAASPPGAAAAHSPAADVVSAPTAAATPSLQIGELIAGAMAKVGRGGVVTMEESRTAEDHLYVVEGMQFDRGYISPYFVTDPERMVSHAVGSGRFGPYR